MGSGLKNGDRMDVKKWNMLLTAVETGSFNKAAEVMGCTQSGMTYMMKSLEEEVGFPLLVRSWNGIRLTENGQKLLPHIRALCSCEAELQQKIDAINGKHERHLSIGTYASVSVHWLPDILAEFRRENPDVEIELRTGRGEEQRKWLEQGEVTFLITDRNEMQQTNWIPLYRDPMLAVLPPEHPAAELDVFTAEDMAGLPLLVSSSMEFYAELLQVFMKRKRGSSVLRVETDDEAVLLRMVAKEIGICILPELTVLDRAKNVVLKPLKPAAYRELGIQTRQEAVTETANAMMELIRSRFTAN